MEAASGNHSAVLHLDCPETVVVRAYRFDSTMLDRSRVQECESVQHGLRSWPQPRPLLLERFKGTFEVGAGIGLIGQSGLRIVKQPGLLTSFLRLTAGL